MRAIRRAKGALFGVGVAPLLLLAAPSAYVGPASCAPCHQAEAAAHHPHDDAYVLLAPAERTVACLPCHVTGYGRPGGWLDEIATPEFAGITCEACHGPGGAHAAGPDAAPLPSPSEATCRRCHTADQDSRFDFDRMKRSIHPKEPTP